MINRGRFRFTAMEQVIFGSPAAETIAKEAARLSAERVFLIVSGSLDRDTDEIDKVRDLLGTNYAGSFDAMPAHSPRDAVIAAANAAREVDTDLLVTIGGGSVTDGTKVVQICLEHDVTSVEGLDAYRIETTADGKARVPKFAGPKVRQISVPTTLSGGEFNTLGGCTDPRTKIKEGFLHPLLVPRAIILDPAPTVHTPEWLWLSTGVRAIDHCVEAICSPRANGYCDGASLHALRLLSRALPKVRADSSDLEARMDCLTGAWLAMTAVIGGIPMGASHAIGHILGGTCDVPHGYTSCIMLPTVLRWNAADNSDALAHHIARQALVSEAFGQSGRAAGDVVDEFVAGLGLPRSLSAVDVGEDQFDVIAKNSMHDGWLHTNPRKVHGPEEVMDILRLAS